MTTPARSAALSAIAACRRRSGYISPIIEATVRRHGLDEPDRGFAVLLAKGVVRTEGTLDEAIARHTSFSRLEPLVLDILRLATYELLFLRSAPHAAVNEAVLAVRRLRPRAASLVNAVLRRIAEDAATFPWGDPTTDIGAQARAAGCPRWLAEALRDDLGAAAGSEALAALASEAPLYLRVNPFKTTVAEARAALDAEGVSWQLAPPDEYALCAIDEAAATRSSALKDGLLYVSDAAAQFAALQCVSGIPMTVLEIGAGRGTKTITIQGALWVRGARSQLIAVEPNDSRSEVLRSRLAAMGVPEVVVVASSIQDVPERLCSAASMDAVFVDAPCTGTGTLRRHPEAVWRLKPDDPARMHGIQVEMLAAASRFVRPGGLLVYSTCSVLRAENHDVVASFLDTDKGRRFVRERIEPAPEEWKAFERPDGSFQSWPREHGPDGHFAARLRCVG